MFSLADQIREAMSMFARYGTEPAMIGILAVVAHQLQGFMNDATRTRDLDDIRALL